MTPSAVGTGISIGTVALVGGVVVIAGIAYILYKNSSKNENLSKKPIRKLISEDDEYLGDKKIIDDAIEENDWETLELLAKDKSIKRFPDLVKKVEEALKNKP